MDNSRYNITAFLGILFISLVSADNFLKEPPSYVLPCKIYEPGFTKCSTNSVQHLFTQLAQGIPGLESVGTTDPFFINKIIYKQDNNQVATIAANLTDIIVKGFANAIVKENRVSKKDFSWDTKLLIPKLRLDGMYKMEGKVLVVPLRGNGKMFIEIENMDLKVHSKIRLYEKGGFTFYNVTNVKIDISISDLKAGFDNLFYGNKVVEKHTIEFFNKNWRDLFEALRDPVIQIVEEILLKILQDVSNYIPANFFVSDIPTSEQLYGRVQNL